MSGQSLALFCRIHPYKPCPSGSQGLAAVDSEQRAHQQYGADHRAPASSQVFNVQVQPEDKTLAAFLQQVVLFMGSHRIQVLCLASPPNFLDTATLYRLSSKLPLRQFQGTQNLWSGPPCSTSFAFIFCKAHPRSSIYKRKHLSTHFQLEQENNTYTQK
jgi:hypothetical protein